MMNELSPPQIFVTLRKLTSKNLRSGILVLLALLISQTFVQAEGSVDFRNYSGKRLFYWANENQQIKVYAQPGEYINLGSSHIGVNGGFLMLYKPNGTLAGIYQDLGLGAGLGIINNDVEELNGPTGGGTINGSGYVPITQEVMAGEEGIWTVVLGFPSTLPVTSNYTFTNLENNETWDRVTYQPNEWAVVAWDATVSTGSAANEGGAMLTGRVYTNQYKAIITGNLNSTSPTFYMMSREGVQYQMDFNGIDPYGFDLSANSFGIVDDLGQPTYSSKATTSYTVSNDPSTWTSGNYYIYDPQSNDEGSLITYKIFFNTPDSNMPAEAMTSNVFTNSTYTTWLNNTLSLDPLSVQGFDFSGVDINGDPTCFGSNMQTGVGGILNYTSNILGTVKLSLDLNDDGDFVDAEDRILYAGAEVGSNELIWDGLDGTGAMLTLANGVDVNYLLEMRNGEMHIMFNDVENNPGGINFTRLNGQGSPSNDFYYDHTEVGGSTSGGAAPSVSSTTTPYTYSSNWGNNKMLDYWTYQDVSGNASGKITVNVVPDCSKPILGDTDNDGINDDVDLDDDNDGIPDGLEFCYPTGGFSCFPNDIDPSGDEDGDLVANYLDADDVIVNNPCIDADMDGVCDETLAIFDNDGDGIADHVDLDSDNDGIPDMVEAGHAQLDSDMDGRIDGVAADFGANGLFNSISSDPDAMTATVTYLILDTNNDNTPDHDDLDSDDDGILDVVESQQVDGDFDGQVGTGIPKVDKNGLSYEDGSGNPVVIRFSPKDLDMDLIPDYRDWDRDGDGIADYYECPDQTNCPDSDTDGNFDVDELDSDGDGLTDNEECPTGIPCPDSNTNGTDDFQEFNACPTFDIPVVTVADNVICEGEVISLSTDAVAGSNISYEWTFTDNNTSYSLGLTTSPNYFINFTNPSHTGTYAVEVRSGSCVSQMSNAENVTVYSTSPPIAINASTQSTPACEGESIQLEVPYMIDATYEWFGPNGFTSTQYDPVITNLTSDNAGSYYAVVNMSDGCATVISTNTTLFVQATPPPAAVESNVAVCEGSDLVLTANPLGVPPNATLSFEWFYQTGTSVGTTSDLDFTVLNIDAASAGEYYVVMTVGNCVAAPSAMVMVEITDTYIADAGNDMAVCGLGNADLTATMPSGGTGQWSSTTGATIDDITNPNSSVSNMTAGNNVFVWSLSNDNCADYATDTIVINYTDPTDDVSNAGTDTQVCNDGTVVLGATTPATAFGIWSQPSTQTAIVISNNTSPTPTVSGMVPGNTYTFTWTLSEGTCLDYDSDEVSITISELPTIAAQVDVEQTYACEGAVVNLTANEPNIGMGTWSTPSSANIPNPNNASTTTNNVPTGANMFIWSLTNGACENYAADTMVVFREDNIEVTDDNFMISLNERLVDEDLLVNDLIGFVNDYDVKITQDPTQGSIQMLDGIFTYEPNHNAYGVDEFEYEVCNVNCPDDCQRATVTITLNGLNEKGECWIPNVLTPNGNGKNDALTIPCVQNFPNNELMVFNRWGDKVFSIVGYQNDWEGTHNGNTLPAGTYYYIFKVDTDDADPAQGFFTIIR
jgi:gliding motility-associated-like protein